MTGTPPALGDLYKVLLANGCSPYATVNGRPVQWPLPDGDKPGARVEAKGGLVACENGVHLCRRNDLIHWLVGPEIYEAEAGGEIIEAGNKVVCRSARLLRRINTWTDTTAQLIKADCAEHVLDVWERHYPEDARPREAIAASRALARGEITARAAASAASAAYAAYAAYVASAASAAGAAGAAERKWQTTRLFDYLEGRACEVEAPPVEAMP